MNLSPRTEGRVAVIGAGFFGCTIAAHFAELGFEVVVCEEADGLFRRASLANQARVHHGYHYPRSLRSGLSCAANFPRFARDYREAIVDGFRKLYAIARRNSKVTASQFAAFCRRIGAPIREASPAIRTWFDADLIEQVFEVQEFAFDADILRTLLESQLDAAGVDLRLNTGVARIALSNDGSLEVELAQGGRFNADRVFTCLYSRTNTLLRASGLPIVPMKHELTEIALVEPPAELGRCGVTVMDGPFFSTMPFPPQGLHSFTHVRYTPHQSWMDPAEIRDPYAYLEGRRSASNFPLMVRDAARYLPMVSRCRHVRSLFEIKSVLIENEENDGRPILYRRDAGLPGLTVVLGGKLDNIYDVLAAIDRDLAVPRPFKFRPEFDPMTDPHTTAPPEHPPTAPVDLMVSVVAALHDDAPVLTDFVREIESVLRDRFPYYEVLLVDNHSSDGTAELAMSMLRVTPCLRYLRLSRASSREIAQAAGLEHAIGDFVVLMDPNLDPCDAIPRMVDAAALGYDVVVGVRTFDPPTGKGRRLLFRIASRMVGAEIDPNLSFFRLFSRRVVNSLTKIKHRRRFLRYLNAIVGFRQTTVPIDVPWSMVLKGQASPILDLGADALDLVFSHSAAPLRWASLMGVAASLLNLSYLLYVLVVVMVKKKLAEGWLTTSVMIGSMFFMLFFMLTVLSEYIARILDEVQERPLYFLELEAESIAATRRPEQSLNVL